VGEENCKEGGGKAGELCGKGTVLTDQNEGKRRISKPKRGEDLSGFHLYSQKTHFSGGVPGTVRGRGKK